MGRGNKPVGLVGLLWIISIIALIRTVICIWQSSCRGNFDVIFAASMLVGYLLYLFTVVVCSLTSIQEARGKRSNHLLVSLSAIAQDKTKAIKTQFRNCT